MAAVIGILVGPKSSGSNMAAIIRACQSGNLEAQVGVVVAPRDDAPARTNAESLGVPTVVIEPGEAYGERLLVPLNGCDVVCLAGYLRLLPDEVLRAFPGRVLNIHPALLPRHGGQGMYGIKVHEAVLRDGDKESGCTVHRVTSEYDKGEILLQRRCPVFTGDTPETLAQRVLIEEHLAYVEALRMVLP
ncbi:MAG: phosphoribosylglycinamide formyltransferase [Armatimonadetes bacterium]|nr:phosphoribosylglycinamide formyltransferase [Armatimonadota bacterium]